MVSVGLASGNLLKKHKEPTVYRLNPKREILEQEPMSQQGWACYHLKVHQALGFPSRCP